MSTSSTHGAARAAVTGQQSARSVRDLRLRLTVICVPVLFVLSGLLAWGAAETETGDTQNVVAVLSTVCFVAFCAALVEAVRLALRYRRDRRSPRAA
jgi:ABC-type transport system involved in cytochrome bd biosynthesis fused ATPase/permease subunit